MLNVLRQNFRETPWLKLILALVGGSLILYLGSYFVGDTAAVGGSAWVARVNGEEIPEWELRNRAQNIDRDYRQMFGDNYDQIRPSLRVGDQALQFLISRKLILQDAQRLGLSGSNRELADRIRDYFRDQNGQFIGTERYKQQVRRQYGKESVFEDLVHSDIVVEKWTSLMGHPVGVMDAELEKVFRKRTEKTAIDYVILSTADQTVDQDVSDEVLSAWHGDHQADYRLSEGRNIRYLVVSRETERSKVLITDDEAKAYYDANQTSFEHPEQRRARHILFRLNPGATDEEKATTRQRAEDTLARVNSGEEFDALARELSDDPVSAEKGGDLGFFGRGDMVGPFQEAAFSTAAGELAPVTESPYGFHVIQVSDSRDAGVSPLEEVLEDIRTRLGFTKAENRVQAEADRIHASISGADKLAEVAAAEGLTLEELTVRRGDRLRSIGASPDFLAAANGLETGTLSTPVALSTGMAILAVDEVLESSIAPLDDVRDDVKTAVLEDRATQAAMATARTSLDNYSDLVAASQALGIDVRSSGDLAPGQGVPGAGGQVPELEQELFADAVEIGRRGVIAVPAGALLYEVTGREPFDPSRFDTDKPSLREEVLVDKRARYVQALLNKMREQQRIEIDEQRVRTAVPTG